MQEWILMDLSITEIKANVEELLERVSAGEEITVTRYGRPLARLIPAEPKTTKEEAQ